MGRLPSLVVLAIILACAGGSSSATSRNCVTVRLVDPLELPDGSVHGAGTLTLCTARSFSPVARLHQVSVDGMPVAVLLSRMGVSEGPAPRDPLVTFRRDRNGRLHLVGYAWPAGRRSQTYLLQDPRASGPEVASAETAGPGTSVARAGHDPPPLLAAVAP